MRNIIEQKKIYFYRFRKFVNREVCVRIHLKKREEAGVVTGLWNEKKDGFWWFFVIGNK